MRAFSCLILTCCFLLASCNPSSSGSTIQRTLSATPALEIGGLRPAKVFLPADYSIATSYPVVLMLHGFGANAELQDVVFGLTKRVTTDQFILITPNGTEDEQGRRFWNATPECCDLFLTGVDDVNYLLGLIDEANHTYATNISQVALVGHSNGGYMSYRMACERPDIIKRVAVLAGSVYLDPTSCVADAPVSLLHLHGTADKVVPYHSTVTATGDDLKTVGAKAAVMRWADRAGCVTSTVSNNALDLLQDQPGNETDLIDWKNCQAGFSIRLLRMNGGDHLALDVNDTFRDTIASFSAFRDDPKPNP